MTTKFLTRRDLVLAAFGVLAGLGLAALGVPVHVGQTGVTGLAAYGVGAIGGGVTLPLIGRAVATVWPI